MREGRCFTCGARGHRSFENRCSTDSAMLSFYYSALDQTLESKAASSIESTKSIDDPMQKGI